MEQHGYRRIRTVGKGAFGQAYLVSDANGNNFVAKQMDLSAMSRTEREACINEVRVLRKLNHPNIIRYVDHFSHQSMLYIVMEYADSGDLHSLLFERQTPLTEDETMFYFVQICLSLKHLHDANILHRDLKAQNIFLAHDKQMIKLGDFGICTVLQSAAALAKTQCGTPFYFSPELCQRLPYNNKSDVWSLGVLLYEMCTLRKPFQAQSSQELMDAICAGRFRPLPEVGYSADLRALLSSMLQTNPEQRPSTTDILRIEFVRKHMQRIVTKSESRPSSGLGEPLLSSPVDDNLSAVLSDDSPNSAPIDVNIGRTSVTPPIAAQETDSLQQLSASVPRPVSPLLSGLTTSILQVGALPSVPQYRRPPCMSAPTTNSAIVSAVAPPIMPPPSGATVSGMGGTHTPSAALPSPFVGGVSGFRPLLLPSSISEAAQRKCGLTGATFVNPMALDYGRVLGPTPYPTPNLPPPPPPPSIPAPPTATSTTPVLPATTTASSRPTTPTYGLPPPPISFLPPVRELSPSLPSHSTLPPATLSTVGLGSTSRPSTPSLPASMLRSSPPLPYPTGLSAFQSIEVPPPPVHQPIPQPQPITSSLPAFSGSVGLGLGYGVSAFGAVQPIISLPPPHERTVIERMQEADALTEAALDRLEAMTRASASTPGDSGEAITDASPSMRSEATSASKFESEEGQTNAANENEEKQEHEDALDCGTHNLAVVEDVVVEEPPPCSPLEEVKVKEFADDVQFEDDEIAPSPVARVADEDIDDDVGASCGDIVTGLESILANKPFPYFEPSNSVMDMSDTWVPATHCTHCEMHRNTFNKSCLHCSRISERDAADF